MMQKHNNETSGTRFVKGRKQEALAEIEGWVGGSREETIKAGAAKVSSHPAKNITEQKMLDSNLYEMSKQRFNFIVQCQWQSKLFLQKQKRKTAVMQDLLQNVDVSILSENPFTIRRKMVTALERKRPSRKEQRSLKSKSLPRLAPPLKPEETKSLQRNEIDIATESVFLTQKFPLIVEQSGVDNHRTFTHDGHDEPHEGANAIWPISDLRYQRLNEVLCENYPKVVHLKPIRKQLNHLTVTTE